MSGALVVIFLVATGEGEAPATRAATQTTHDALDKDALVVVREADASHLDDAEAQRIAEKLPADAVVVVSWKGADHLTAIATVRIARHPDPIERRLTFASTDLAEERGTSIGYAVASILARVPTSPVSRLPEPVKAPPPSQVDRVATAPPPKPSHVLAVDAVAHGALGTATQSAGAEIAGRVWLADGFFAVRANLGARFGEVPNAASDSVLLRTGLGVAFRPIGWSENDRVGFGARVGFLGLWQHLEREDTGSSGSWLLPGFEASFEGSCRLGAGISVIAAVGSEVALGPVQIFVDDKKTATVGPFRGLGELGLRWEP